MNNSATIMLSLAETGPVELTLDDRGDGHPVVLLHGGAGPQSMADFAILLATTRPAHVLTPTHPGFGGTLRPEGLSTIKGLATLYSGLLDRMDLASVTVVGNSIGGWIAAELAIRAPERLSSLILVNAVGIEVPDHPITDVSALALDQIQNLSYHDPTPFRIDPASLPEAARAVAAGNRAALAAYSSTSMSDPGLKARLGGITVPTVVLWGEADRIADPEYGRTYAGAIPGAEFRLLPGTGHVPQVETPGQLLDAVWEFAHAKADGNT